MYKENVYVYDCIYVYLYIDNMNSIDSLLGEICNLTYTESWWINPFRYEGNPLRINTVSHDLPNRLEINNIIDMGLDTQLMFGMAPDSRSWEV